MSDESEMDFTALLDTNCDEVHEPLPTPKGFYTLTVGSNKKFGKSSVQETPFVELEFVDPIPGDDVDEDLFEQYVASRPKGLIIKNKFYLSDGAKFMLKNFFKAVGINTTGRSLGDCLEDVPGEDVGAFIEVKAGQNGRHYSEIKEFRPAA